MTKRGRVSDRVIPAKAGIQGRRARRLPRVKLFRLAWDAAGSAFGSRQVLYERFFASDPLTRARAMAAIYPKGEMMERVLEFLGRDD